MAEFTSEVVGTGGRDGRVRSSTDSYDHRVVLPGSGADGVTPEELLAGAWAACFGGAFIVVARQHGVVADDARFHVAITLDSDLPSMRFSIARAALRVELADVDDATVDRILEEAHAICPVSKLFVGGADSVEVGRAQIAA